MRDIVQWTAILALEAIYGGLMLVIGFMLANVGTGMAVVSLTFWAMVSITLVVMVRAMFPDAYRREPPVDARPDGAGGARSE